MMMCVQMDKKEEFDRIWKWTYTYMLHRSGKYKGYFAWSLNPDGTGGARACSDGEEYFAMALLLRRNAGGRAGTVLYSRQARNILREVVHKGEDGIGSDVDRTQAYQFIPEVLYGPVVSPAPFL